MNIEEEVKGLLEIFIHQFIVNKMETEDGFVKIYKVGKNLIRIDIKVDNENELRKKRLYIKESLKK